jgi:hypothetical protein
LYVYVPYESTRKAFISTEGLPLDGNAFAEALALNANAGYSFAPDADLVAAGSCGAAAVNARSFRNGGKAHDSLLVTLTIHARVLIKLRVSAADEAHYSELAVSALDLALHTTSLRDVTDAKYSRLVVAFARHTRGSLTYASHASSGFALSMSTNIRLAKRGQTRAI